MNNTFYAIKVKDKETLLCGYFDRGGESYRMTLALWKDDVPFLFHSEEDARNSLKDNYYYSWPKGYQLEVIPIMLFTEKQLAELEIDKMLRS